MTKDEQFLLERHLNKPSGVPNWRYYLSIITVASIFWVGGFFHGKNVEQQAEAEITIKSQEKVLETHTDVYSGMPRSRDDAIKWLYDHSS